MKELIEITKELMTDTCAICNKEFLKCYSPCMGRRKANKINLYGMERYFCTPCYNNLEELNLL